MGDAMRTSLLLVSTPSVVAQEGLGSVLGSPALDTALAVVPVLLVCCIAGVAVNVA